MKRSAKGPEEFRPSLSPHLAAWIPPANWAPEQGSVLLTKPGHHRAQLREGKAALCNGLGWKGP